MPQSLDQLVESVIGAAITVHKAMGPGLLINFNSVLLKDGIHRLYRGARA